VWTHCRDGLVQSAFARRKGQIAAVIQIFYGPSVPMGSTCIPSGRV